MKKRTLVSIISAVGGAAGYEAYKELSKKHKHVKPFYTVTTGSILAGMLADHLIPEDEPYTHTDYLNDAASKNKQA